MRLVAYVSLWMVGAPLSENAGVEISLGWDGSR